MTTTLIAAITADGFIGQTSTSSSFTWTSDADKQFYVSQLKAADAIVMGRTTFETFNRHPKGSSWYIYTSKPESFVNAKPEVINAEGVNDQPQVLIERLNKMGKQNVLIAGGSSIYQQFMAAGVVDRVLLTVEPILFGDGVRLFNQAFEPIQLSAETVVLEYLVGSKV
jgi:dihydrofolate reductase